MIFLRHKNGNGKVWGLTADIDRDSFLDKSSNLFDDSDVWQSRIIDTTIAFDSKVRNSVLLHSKVGSQYFESEITDSRLKYSFIEGGKVLGAVVNNSYVSQNCVVKGGYLENCHLTGSVVIENQPILKNVRLYGQMRIGYGTWERTPRYLHLKTDTIDCGVTESSDGYAYIGCQRKKIKDWLKGAKRYSAIAGWNEEMTETVIKQLQEWL